MAPKMQMMFDQGQVPKIVLVDATVKEKLEFEIEKLAVALKEYLEKHFAPVWGVTGVIGISKGQVIPLDAWAIVLLDDPDAAGAFGYHDITDGGLPLSKVFVSVCRQHGEEISMTVSHELVEMLVDPGIQMLAQGPKGIIYAYEVADATQNEGFNVGGFKMTNFHYPAWFEEFRDGATGWQGKYDHLGTCSKPFELRPGGYMPVWKKGQWTQIFYSKAVQKQFVLEEHPRTKRRTEAE